MLGVAIGAHQLCNSLLHNLEIGMLPNVDAQKRRSAGGGAGVAITFSASHFSPTLTTDRGNAKGQCYGSVIIPPPAIVRGVGNELRGVNAQGMRDVENHGQRRRPQPPFEETWVGPV